MANKIIKDENKALFRNANKNVTEWKSIQKMMDMFENEMSRNWEDNEKVILWSDGNSKTHIPSYSTMPGFSCRTNGAYPPCFTSGQCYALYDLRNPEVIKNAVHNTVLILKYPREFEASLDLKMKLTPAIRLHVEGDFVNMNELAIVDRTRKNNPSSMVMTYTKKYSMVNAYMDKHGMIDGNFKLLYSKWDGFEMINPYHMPECHVYKTVGEYISANDRRACGFLTKKGDGYEFNIGNCACCFMNHLLKNGMGGCFDIGNGDGVKMLAH